MDDMGALEDVTRREFLRRVGKGATGLVIAGAGLAVPMAGYGQEATACKSYDEAWRVDQELIPKLEWLGEDNYRRFLSYCGESPAPKRSEVLKHLPELRGLYEGVEIEVMDAETHESIRYVKMRIKLVGEPVIFLDWLKKKIDDPSWSAEKRACTFEQMERKVKNVYNDPKRSQPPLPEEITGCEGETALPNGYARRFVLFGRRYEVTMQHERYKFKREEFVVSPGTREPNVKFEFFMDRIATKVRVE